MSEETTTTVIVRSNLAKDIDICPSISCAVPRFVKVRRTCDTRVSYRLLVWELKYLGSHALSHFISGSTRFETQARRGYYQIYCTFPFLPKEWLAKFVKRYFLYFRESQPVKRLNYTLEIYFMNLGRHQ